MVNLLFQRDFHQIPNYRNELRTITIVEKKQDRKEVPCSETTKRNLEGHFRDKGKLAEKIVIMKICT